jgi:hypothetical protein
MLAASAASPAASAAEVKGAKEWRELHHALARGADGPGRPGHGILTCASNLLPEPPCDVIWVHRCNLHERKACQGADDVLVADAAVGRAQDSQSSPVGLVCGASTEASPEGGTRVRVGSGCRQAMPECHCHQVSVELELPAPLLTALLAGIRRVDAVAERVDVVTVRRQLALMSSPQGLGLCDTQHQVQ